MKLERAEFIGYLAIIQDPRLDLQEQEIKPLEIKGSSIYLTLFIDLVMIASLKISNSWRRNAETLTH